MTTTLNNRVLAGTDITTSPMAFGAMTFGGQVDEHDAAQMFTQCREAGITVFDTSNNYNGGRSEEILGRLTKDQRDEIVLCTKVGSPWGQSDPDLIGLRPDSIRKALDGSLRRLGTDYIDIYYLHCPDPSVPIEATLEALGEAQQAGKIRHVGQSNFAAWQITEMVMTADRLGMARPVLSQPMYNLVSRRPETEYAACSEHLGLSNLVYNPLAGGLLTGKHRIADAPQPGTRFEKAAYRDRYWTAELFGACERLSSIAAAAGMTPIELALRWLVVRPLVTCVLIGASSAEHLSTNLAAAAGPTLDTDVLGACDNVWDTIVGAAPDYNR
jgi:aryl-alcohol dehydrogenase-like predicted oxidoreductase